MSINRYNDCEVSLKMLSPDIAVLAKQSNGHESWAAYVMSLAIGIPEELMIEQTAKYGTKLPYEIAALMFPEFAKKYPWRN